MITNFELGIDFAKKLDENDEISHIRSHFYIKENEIYMDGNSLGMCSRDAEGALLNMLALWKEHGINIWNIEEGKYFLYQNFLGALMAPLINADSAEVTVSNSTTVNIHQGIATFYKLLNVKL